MKRTKSAHPQHGRRLLAGPRCLSLELLETRDLLAVVIDLGSHPLLPDTPGQWVDVTATGTDAVTGFNLRAQIGDRSNGPKFQTVQFMDGAGGDAYLWDAHAATAIGEAPVAGAERLAQISVVFSAPGRPGAGQWPGR